MVKTFFSKFGNPTTDSWLSVVRGVAINLFWGYNFFWGGIKLQYSCSIAVLTLFLPNKVYLDWFWGYIYPYIPTSLRPWCLDLTTVPPLKIWPMQPYRLFAVYCYMRLCRHHHQQQQQQQCLSVCKLYSPLLRTSNIMFVQWQML